MPDTNKDIKKKYETDRFLLERLVCPITRTTLRYDASAQELISEKAGYAFPIRNGVPIMVVESARDLRES
jgi:uncharacterized protein